jgi:4-hydroxy-tetrahydrodipicolinate synthase
MAASELRGVIAAAATPVTLALEPDLPRFVTLCRWLLDRGCDGLNICGTTGEATSLTVSQRMATMSAAASELPRSRLMAGTGAAALGDAIALTRHATELGIAGALLLPPFYYKSVGDDGIADYIGCIAEATAARPIDLYLYNFPQLSGLTYSPALVARLVEKFGPRIAGLKDSSGDLAYASEVAAISKNLRVFPSNEAVLLRARAGEFAGCISASVNVNSEFAARAFREGDEEALETASTIRALVSEKSLIASVKAVLAHRLDDRAFENILPPLTRLTEAERHELIGRVAPLLPRN